MRSRILAVLVVAFALVAAACGGDGDTTTTTTAGDATTTTAGTATTAAGDTTTTTASGEPIIIGAAIDQTSFMAPFDSPAIVAAQIAIDEVNAAGGVLGRPLQLEVIDTQLDAAQTTSAAIDLIEGGAVVLLVTCDVDFATPAVQEALSRGVLAVAPCIGTDQMGPERFGEAGELAFSFGNLAQDEGAVMAEYAIDQGWMTAAVVRDNLIVYFQDVVDAFAVRYQELGGEITVEEAFTNGDGTIGNVSTSVANAGVDVIVTSTAFDDLPALAQGVRSLGSDTPMLCSWSCDGAFWVPEGLSGFHFVTFVSVYGDDPDSEVQDLIAAMEAAGVTPATGGFVTGASVIDALVAAIEETGGTNGADLAAVFESFSGQPTVSGSISFSDDFHTVFGREYRVIEITDGSHAVVEVRAATSPATG
jgi:branched-chain amino acid transport system substrate-binding protein